MKRDWCLGVNGAGPTFCTKLGGGTGTGPPRGDGGTASHSLGGDNGLAPYDGGTVLLDPYES